MSLTVDEQPVAWVATVDTGGRTHATWDHTAQYTTLWRPTTYQPGSSPNRPTKSSSPTGASDGANPGGAG